MEKNFLFLGVVFILILFGIGENFLKRLHLKKSIVLVATGLLLLSLLFPMQSIFDFTFSITFALLLIIATLCLKGTTNKKYLSRFLLSYLFGVLFMQILFLLEPLFFPNQQAIFILTITLLGFLTLAFCKFPKQTFSSLFFSIHTAQIIQSLTKSKPLVLGDEIILFSIFIAIFFVSFMYNLIYVAKSKKRVKAFWGNKK